MLLVVCIYRAFSVANSGGVGRGGRLKAGAVLGLPKCPFETPKTHGQALLEPYAGLAVFSCLVLLAFMSLRKICF